MRWAFRLWGQVTSFVSAEWLLTRARLPNGGGVILFRAFWTAAILFGFMLAARNILDPERGWSFSASELQTQTLQTGKWFVGTFAAVYTALYARFSSQWLYLANVYNQIKAAQSREPAPKTAIQEWQAGFIEDAENLHLATKPLFASVIKLWSDNTDVRSTYARVVQGGEDRLNKLLAEITTILEEEAKRHRS